MFPMTEWKTIEEIGELPWAIYHRCRRKPSPALIEQVAYHMFRLPMHFRYISFAGTCTCIVHLSYKIQQNINYGDIIMSAISNHRHLAYLLNRLFRRRSKKTSKLRVMGPCAGNSPVAGEFPSQRTSNAENVSIWWRHHVKKGDGAFRCLSWINQYFILSDNLFVLSQNCIIINSVFSIFANSAVQNISMKTSIELYFKSACDTHLK